MTDVVMSGIMMTGIVMGDAVTTGTVTSAVATIIAAALGQVAPSVGNARAVSRVVTRNVAYPARERHPRVTNRRPRVSSTRPSSRSGSVPS